MEAKSQQQRESMETPTPESCTHGTAVQRLAHGARSVCMYWELAGGWRVLQRYDDH